MGSCFSTNKPPPSPEFHRQSSKSSRGPPPVEEETVKEVLSESPNRKHVTEIENEPRQSTPRQSLHKIQHQHNNNHEDTNVSEIRSTMSESISSTTFEEDIDVLSKRMTDRSPAKLRNRQHNSGELRVVYNSPGRGKQHSPGRIGSVYEINNRGSGFGSAGRRQRPVSGTVKQSRSRSPSNRTPFREGRNGAMNVTGRSPTARKKEYAPGRYGSGLPERVLKPDLSTGMETEVSQETSWPPRNDDESFENPLVSLECFIFL